MRKTRRFNRYHKKTKKDKRHVNRYSKKSRKYRTKHKKNKKTVKYRHKVINHKPSKIIKGNGPEWPGMLHRSYPEKVAQNMREAQLNKGVSQKEIDRERLDRNKRVHAELDAFRASKAKGKAPWWQ